MPHMKSNRVPSNSHRVVMGGIRRKGRESERKVKHQPHFPFKSLKKKEPHDVGLRGWTDSTSVAKWEKRYTWRVFISAQIKGTWKKGEITTALSRKQVPRRHLNLEKYNWKRSDKHLPIWVCDVLNGIRKEAAWALITVVIVRITLMNTYGEMFSAAKRRIQKEPFRAFLQDETMLKKACCSFTHANVTSSGGNSTCIENDSGLLHQTNIGSLEYTGARHTCCFTSPCGCTLSVWIHNTSKSHRRTQYH